MLHPKALREEVIRPTLNRLGLYTGRKFGGQNVEDLLVMIAAHESHLGKYRRQVGGGPARGIYQIEIPTHEDLYTSYLFYRDKYLDALRLFTSNECDLEYELENNDSYATAAARFLLWRIPEAIPEASRYDSEQSYLFALAEYAKKHWNTEGGAATPEKYLEDFHRLGGLV